MITSATSAGAAGTVDRLVASLRNATYRPLGLITGSNEGPLPTWPEGVALTSVVWPVAGSRTKTSLAWLGTSRPLTRSVASLAKTSFVPSALRLALSDCDGLAELRAPRVVVSKSETLLPGAVPAALRVTSAVESSIRPSQPSTTSPAPRARDGRRPRRDDLDIGMSTRLRRANIMSGSRGE